jgi:hypothetical protein
MVGPESKIFRFAKLKLATDNFHYLTKPEFLNENSLSEVFDLLIAK